MSLAEEHGAEFEIDSASMLGVTLLGQLVRHLAEATHVLEFVTGQVDLNLEETSSALAQATYEANQAFQAASLLLRGAALDESWSRNASRPKAVFARHNAAVAAGAPRVEPARAPMLVHRESSPAAREELPPKPPKASRPRCGHAAKSTGKPCANHVVVLEHGVLASGCATHLPAAEQGSYDRQKAQTDAWIHAAAEHQQSDKARMMADATALWLRRQARELGMEWREFCQTVGADSDLTDKWHDLTEETATDDGWTACETCLPYFVDTVARVSVGMQFLHSWAAGLRPPRWADHSKPGGDWLLDCPPRALTQDHELGLYLAASTFAEVATPTDDLASAVEVRHREIVDSVLGYTAHVDSVGALGRSDAEEKRPTTAPPRPGARPAQSKRSKKKRKKR